MRYVHLYNTQLPQSGPGEPNADAGDEGLAQIPPAPLRQITAQSHGTRQLAARAMLFQYANYAIGRYLGPLK